MHRLDTDLLTMDQEQAFYELLDNHISSLSDKKREKYLITQQLYDQILDVVNQSEGHKCEYGAKFSGKYWCKTNFKSENISF